MRARAFSIKMEAHNCFPYMQVANEDFRKPIGQLRIKQQETGWRKGIEAQNRLHNREHARSRPGLRPICFGIERRKRVFVIARVPAEALRKAVVVEEITG